MKCSNRRYILIMTALLTTFLMVSIAVAVPLTKNIDKDEFGVQREKLDDIKSDGESDIKYNELIESFISKIESIKGENLDFNKLEFLFNIDDPEVLAHGIGLWLIFGTILGVLFSGFTLATTPFSWPIWGIVYVINRENDPTKEPPTSSEKRNIFTIATLLGPISAFVYGYVFAALLIMPGPGPF